MKRISSFLLCLIPLLNIAQDSYTLEIIDDYASCVVYTVKNESGDFMILPPDIAAALDCPNIVALRDTQLIYMIDDSVFCWDIITGSSKFVFHNTMKSQGFDGPFWSPSGKRIAFVAVDMEERTRVEDMCRIVVVDISGSPSQVIASFNGPVYYECGSICLLMDGALFFADENTIRYQRHEMIDVDPGKWVTLTIIK